TFKAKVAVVTGSNKGNGFTTVRAHCKQFQGDVYLTDLICHEGLKPLFHQLDIIDLNSLKTAAAFFKEKYGGVDILINNAGIGFKATDTTPFGIQAEVTLRTNFFGTRDVLTHFMPLIKAEGENNFERHFFHKYINFIQREYISITCFCYSPSSSLLFTRTRRSKTCAVVSSEQQKMSV
uniref:Carbonyl reductase 1 n=1 Tax=Poecilia reticulata TaxID=8081 RepID=A0A3P9NFC7_POERE